MTHSGQKRFMMSSPYENMNFIQLEDSLGWKKVAYQRPITSEIAENVYLFDQVRNLSMLKFQTHILGQDLPSHTVCKTSSMKFPTSPWQHFKQKHATSWWMRKFVSKWPVKLDTHNFSLTATWDQMVTYPWQKHVKYDRKQLGQPVRIIQPAKINYKEFINNDPTDR